MANLRDTPSGDTGYIGMLEEARENANAATLRAEAERDRYRRVLGELLDAGEPYIAEAFPVENLNGHWLRIYNRWLAAMNDAREAQRHA